MKKRLEYIDALRGFMILMVVYVHMITLNIGMNVECGRSFIIDVFGRFRMPLFFSITGFFAYGKYDLVLFRKRFINRINKQLWPTVLIGIILIFIVRGNLSEFIIDDSKSGYWFTYCLVQVWLLYATIACILNYLRLSNNQIIITMGTIAVILLPISAILNKYFPSVINNTIFKILSLSHTTYLSPFFFIGVILRMIYNKTTLLIINKELPIFVTLLIIFSGLFILDSFIFIRMSEVVGVFLAFLLFYYTRFFWDGISVFSKSLKVLGKNTLVIYLFHYYIIYYLRKYHLTDSLHPLIGNLLELPVIFFLSMIVSYICIGIDLLLKKNKSIHHFIFWA